MNTITIRKFKKADQQQVYRLISSVLRDEFSLDGKDAFPASDIADIAGAYNGPRDIFFVAMDGDALAGTIAVKEDDHNTALLRRIFVSPHARGMGLGKQLILKAIEFCELHAYGVINFYSTDTMKAAIGLCKKNGFKRRAAMHLDNCTLLRFCRRMRCNIRRQDDQSVAKGRRKSVEKKTVAVPA